MPRNYSNKEVGTAYRLNNARDIDPKVWKLSKRSSDADIQQAREIIKNNPDPYRKAYVDYMAEQVSTLTENSDNPFLRDQYYGSLDERLLEKRDSTVTEREGLSTAELVGYYESPESNGERRELRRHIEDRGISPVFKELSKRRDEERSISRQREKHITRMETKIQTLREKEQSQREKFKAKHIAYRQATNAQKKELRDTARVALRELKKSQKSVTKLENLVERQKEREQLALSRKRMKRNLKITDSVDISYAREMNNLANLLKLGKRPIGV